MDLYYRIAKDGEGKVTEKMSRFLAFAIDVRSAEEARNIIKDYQNKFHDARHICWAYMLGPEMKECLFNDNGEPSGTAGKPILGQIRSHGVTDVLIIVVRYFGGIKLGTSGLISAYRTAASLALENAGRQEVYKQVEAIVEVPYIVLDKVMRIIKEEQGIELLESEYNNLCRLKVRMREDFAANLIAKMEKGDGVIIELIN